VGKTLYPITYGSDTIVELGNISVMKSSDTLSIGMCVKRSGVDAVAKSTDDLFGLVLGQNEYGEYYIQAEGYLNGNKLGSTTTTGWAAGNYLKVGSDSYLTTTNDPTEAVARIDFVESGVFYIRMLNTN
jgi:hypothetical protein